MYQSTLGRPIMPTQCMYHVAVDRKEPSWPVTNVRQNTELYILVHI